MTECFGEGPRRTLRRARLLASTALLSLTVSTVATDAQTACQDNLLPQPEGCQRANGDIAVEMPVGENAETVETAPGAGFPTLGFSISIEGQTIAGALAPATPQRTTDRQAAAA